MSPHAGYLLQEEVVPRLVSAIPNAVSFIAPEDAKELIADGTAMAAQMIHNAERNGKKVVKVSTKFNGQYRKQAKEVTCGNIAYYTIQKLRSGRRSTGSSIKDVCANGTQLNGNSRLESMEQVVASNDESGSEIYELHDVLASNQEDPSVKAARRMDWDSFLSGVSEQDKTMITLLVDGFGGSEIARKLKVCTSTIHHRKRHLALAIQEFMGLDIIIDVQKQPGWKDSINAARERMTCKYERCR